MRCWPVSGSQIRTVRSLPALASSSFPATVTGHTPFTSRWWPSRVVRCWPVWGSQIRTVPSLPALASSSSPATVTGHTDQTPPWWPSRMVRCWPVWGSQIRTVPSSLALASSSFPATVTGQTDQRTPPSPSIMVRCLPVWGSQIRTVPSPPALASSSFPATVTGHTPLTPPWWPSIMVRCSPVWGSQIRTVPSVPALASSCLPGHGDRAHADDPALVAFQGGALAAGLDRGPQGPVRALPAAVAVTGAQVVEGLGDTEQRGPIRRARGDRPRGQPQQLSPAAPRRRAGPVGGLDQPPQIGVQQVGIVAEQVIDQPGGGGVAGQRAQQVLRSILPLRSVGRAW